MGIGYRIKEARERLGLTQTELGTLVGVTGSAITNYEKETSHPKEPVMYKMLEVLNVDANYLFQDVIKVPTKKNDVTLAEYDHIKKYRDLDDIGRNHVDTVMEWEADRIKALSAEPEKKKSNIIPMRLISYYYKNASAGTGEFVIDTLPEKDIEIPALPKYKEVSYAIGVNGNSMEPVYHDGDVLLVEATSELKIGDIGIFLIGSECYVKKMGETELISLNKDYDNIPLSESARIWGKVIDTLHF